MGLPRRSSGMRATEGVCYVTAMRSYASFLTLVAELEGDLVELTRVLGQNRRARERLDHGADDPLDWAALGFTLHSAYGVLENYFLRISKFFENSLPAEGWHKALVQKMAVDIPGLRPALLTTRENRQVVLELLKFRHRFRNLYGEDLEPAKTSVIQKAAEGFWVEFREQHREFVHKLR
jgi:hypothetical protein